MKQSLHGAIHVKRCYCSAEFAVKNLALLKQHSIRPMVNATAGKNCTDIALAIDAVQLCERERAGGGRHRRLGLRLRAAGDAPARPRLPGRRRRPGRQGRRRVAAGVRRFHRPCRSGRGRAAKARRPGGAAPRRREPRGAGGRAASQAPAAGPLPGEVERWLDAVPGLASGERVELKVAAEALRKEKLLSRNASSTTLFKKHPRLVRADARRGSRTRSALAARRRTAIATAAARAGGAPLTAARPQLCRMAAERQVGTAAQRLRAIAKRRADLAVPAAWRPGSAPALLVRVLSRGRCSACGGCRPSRAGRRARSGGGRHLGCCRARGAGRAVAAARDRPQLAPTRPRQCRP